MAISARGLRKYYGEIRAVDGVDLEVAEGEVFGILGPNGAGKTTTLEMLETIREPDAGEVKILGYDARRNPREIKELIGVQLQTTAFFDELTVWETIDLFRSFYSRALPISRLVELVELEDKAGARVNSLSGGQHKRLSIALALVNDPRLIFLDEPTTGLDPQARRRIWDLVGLLRGEGKTVVITTHYIEEAEELCERVAVMDHGRIIATGTPHRLILEHVPESTITFTMRPGMAMDRIKEIPGVVKVSCEDGHYRVITTSPHDTLMAIVSSARRKGLDVQEVNMRRASLEDVFLKLTGRTIRA